MAMYGIISFILLACIYAIVPRLSLREPKQIMVGMHFWLAFIGLMAYMISLMAGGTLKGLSWINGDPFIESVTLMMPFWVWMAIGGTMMFISNLRSEEHMSELQSLMRISYAVFCLKQNIH